MFDDSRSFVSRAFLQSIYDIEFKAYLAEGRDEIVHARLRAWNGRARQTETQDESAFIQAFFVELWGFGATGLAAPEEHTIIPKFGVAGAGAKGGAGEADLALGWFKGRNDAVPQVLCEFKDIRSDLDTNVWTGCVSQEGICWKSEVADMYPACLIGSWAVALMGIRTRHGSH